jgi:hypothetical protein
MPIPFHCPHCGAFTEVDDIYAGHSGPCATCNKPITIPYVPAAMLARGGAGTAVASAPARTRTGVFLLLLVIALCAVAVVVLLAMGIALVQPVIQSARSAAWQGDCQTNLERIGLALQAYQAEHGSYPPAYIPGPDGKPMHSWRVLILPFLGNEGQLVYQRYDFNQPWDSDHNMGLAGLMPDVYACPEHPDALPNQETTYMVIVGPETMFPGSRSVSPDQIGDSLDQTIMVVETPQSGVHWLKPQDLEAARMAFEINGREETDPGSHHVGGGAHVLMADGTVVFLPDDFSSDYLTSMSTINRGEVLPRNVLDGY